MYGLILTLFEFITKHTRATKFTASDLGEIARELDDLERVHRHDDDISAESMNMDDTGSSKLSDSTICTPIQTNRAGYFSVQVIEKALENAGATVERWSSSQVRASRPVPQ